MVLDTDLLYEIAPDENPDNIYLMSEAKRFEECYQEERKNGKINHKKLDEIIKLTEEYTRMQAIKYNQQLIWDEVLGVKYDHDESKSENRN